jgi:hypothetical protein
VGSHHLGDLLSLVRQGLTVGVEYGAHSIEALLWIAETVEESVYEPHSLRRTADGLAFAIDNPLLRVGAFASLALRVNGTPIEGDRVRLRPGSGTDWRTASSVNAPDPLALVPGDRTEFEVVGDFGQGLSEITVRLELHTPAIPPRVWFEFVEVPAEVAAPS